MGMSPSLSYKSKEGGPRLALMEMVIELDRPFMMIEFEEYTKEIRYCWDNTLLIIVGSEPLLYDVTRYGRDLTARAQETRRRDIARQQLEEEQIAA
jgi:hypothetical protein